MCLQRCHQLSNHSKMPCDHVLSEKCSKGHVKSWRCHQNAPTSCQQCERDANMLVRKQQKALELHEQRERDEREHTKRMAELDEQMEAERQKLKDAQLSKERSLAAQQKLKDLENLKALDHDPQKMPIQKIESHAPSNKAVQNIPKPKINETRHDPIAFLPAPAQASHENHESGARKEWQYQKNSENASNDAIDSVMEMIGLEEVKAQILRIKAKVDVSLRQNSNLKDDRFNTVFQGNPGTGMHYLFLLIAAKIS